MKSKKTSETSETRMTVNDAIKGMVIDDWEVRYRCNGSKKVYLRFREKKPSVSVVVDE